MAGLTDVVRNILIRGKSEGLDELQGKLRAVGAAEDAVAVAVEKTDKATLSLQSRINSLQKSLDAEYRAEQQLEKIHRDLNAARSQGLITADRQAQLSSLAAAKYKVEGEAVEGVTERMKLFKEVAMGVVAGVGAGFLLTGLAELPAKIKETVAAAAELKDSAETIGITGKALQELNFAASQSGVSTETMSEALKKFSTNLGIAETGTGKLNEVLKANHVAISGDVQKDFLNYIELIRNAGTASEKNYLTTVAFGKSAQDLGRLATEGAAGIKAMGDEADRTGQILGDDLLAKAKEIDDQFAKLQGQLNVAFEEFTIEIAPALVTALEHIETAVRNVNGVRNFLNPDHETILKRLNQANNGGRPTVEDAFGAPTADYRPPADNDNGAVSPSSFNFRDLLDRPRTIVPKAPDAGAAAQAKAIKTVTDALALQTKNLTETNRQQFINNQLSQAKVTSASKEGKAISDLAGHYYDQKQAIDAANQASMFLAQTFESSIEGMIDGSKSFSDVLGDMASALEKAVIQSALLGSGPLAGLFGTQSQTSGGVGGLFGSLLSGIIKPNASGDVYASAGLHQYANQVVDKPIVFPFARGGAVGVAGEAGPEAIMPLSRGRDGKLGVVAANGNSNVVYLEPVINNYASDQVNASASINADGQLIVVVDKIVGKLAGDQSSRTNRGFRQAFGLSDATASRS